MDALNLAPPFPWTCPFCNSKTTINEGDISRQAHGFSKENKQGTKRLFSYFIVCPNPECKELTLIIDLHPTTWTGTGYAVGELERRWMLIPPSNAKPFPAYIPAAILADYYEACLIQDLSPKASATLARRCLQGMIRDFWHIIKGTLNAEIQELQDKVDSVTWAAIDAVRQVGNIGAHMEKDVNVIIDVEPEEAAMLIGLLETLFEEWYVNRHERDERAKKIIELGAAKSQPKSAKP